MAEVDKLVRFTEAWDRFGVDGTGSCIAVIDTGLRATHRAFRGRVIGGFDAGTGDVLDPSFNSDDHGHGTHVTGIACGGKWQTTRNDKRLRAGVAPNAKIVTVRALGGSNARQLGADGIEKGLRWLTRSAEGLGVSVVCMSLSDGENHTQNEPQLHSGMAAQIAKLTNMGIPVVAAAGNHYKCHASAGQGMGFPAIMQDVISVGAIFDRTLPEREREYNCSAKSYRTRADQITPFSQRLHRDIGHAFHTTIFAPGAEVNAPDWTADNKSRSTNGTSQATPVVAGAIALMQHAYSKWSSGETWPTKPSVEELKTWLRETATPITDSETEDDNVPNTGKEFLRIDVLRAVQRAFHEGQRTAA
jgi:subtilisin family serine protease